MENNNKGMNKDKMNKDGMNNGGMNKNGMNNGGNKKKQNKNTKWIFLGSVIALYLVLFLINSEKTLESANYSINLIISIVPVLVLVLVFMILFNLIDEKKLKAIIEKSPQHIQYIVMSILGTFSHGPIYAWYPLMKEFHDKGISYGSVAAFLYARGIKLTFLPVLISYFGLNYTIILTIYMFLFSYLQGILTDIFIREASA